MMRSYFNPFKYTGSIIKVEDNHYDGFLFYGSLISSLTLLYILSIQGIDWVLKCKQILMVGVPILLGLRVLYLKRLNAWYVAFALATVIYAYMTKRFDAFAEFILLSWMVFLSRFRCSIVVEKKTARFVGLILCLIVFIHFINFDSKGRESIGGLDPNYTGFLIFLIVPLGLFSKSFLLNFFIVALGLATKSRGFFVAINVYFASWLFFRHFQNLRLDYKKYLLLFIILFLMMIGYSLIGYSSGIESYGMDENGIGRFFNLFNNRSDYGRWEANVLFLKSFLHDFRLLLLGVDANTYFNKISQYLPHNLPFLEIATHGLFIGGGFLLTFFGLLRHLFTKRSLPFLLGLLIYWLFLGVEIGAVYNVVLVNMFLFLNVNDDGESDKLIV